LSHTGSVTLILQSEKNRSSEKLQREQIQQLISRTVKHTNYHYRCVADKSGKDRWAARQDRVWNRLRDELSVEAFKDARTSYWQMNQFQQRDFIERHELEYDRR
jgi:hypothetical protein